MNAIILKALTLPDDLQCGREQCYSDKLRQLFQNLAQPKIKKLTKLLHPYIKGSLWWLCMFKHIHLHDCCWTKRSFPKQTDHKFNKTTSC